MLLKWSSGFSFKSSCYFNSGSTKESVEILINTTILGLWTDTIIFHMIPGI